MKRMQFAGVVSILLTVLGLSVSAQAANAAPLLTVSKTANKTSVVSHDLITYTLTYSNKGTTQATNVKLTDTITPSVTSFDYCSGGCTVTNAGSTVTWSLGNLAPNTTASKTLTVRVRTYIDQCQICNVAKLSSPDYMGGAAVSSSPACVSARPSSDPTDAVARGDAWGLKTYVPLLGLPLLNTTIAPTSSSQTGIGQSANSNEFLKLDIKDLTGLTKVARADVLRTTSSSQVNTQFGPRQTTTSEVLGLNLLNGLVTADVVRSVASTTATGSSSSFSAAGTTAANLKVAGNPVTNLAPGTRIPLNALLFGFNSYVAVNEQSGWTSRPAAGQTGGGRYKADLTVTMIRVRVTGGTVGSLFTLGGPPLEISVAKATAHSEHKQLRICTTAPTRAVSGHALIASAQVDPLLPTSTVGFVKVPETGGNGHMEITGSVLPQDGSIVNTADAVTDATGTLGPISTSASSYAQVANACVLRIASAACLIKATLIRSQANSRMNGGGGSSDATGTQFLNLVVAGIPIAGTPAPNTVRTLPGLGYVVLNEQVADGPEPGHTGLTVRAIRVKITLPFAPLLRGAEIIVAEAHSDATFRS